MGGTSGRSRVGTVVLTTALGLAATAMVPTAAPAAAQAAGTWTTVELLPLVEGAEARVHDVTDSGVSVGVNAGPPGQVSKAVRWDADGEPTALPVPEGCTHAMATDISNTGLMLGQALCEGFDRPLRWDAAGALVPTTSDVYTLLPNSAVSDTGYVAGSVASEGRWRPAVQAFAGGPITLLPDGGSPYSEVRGITSYGYVVGNVLIPGRPGSDDVPAGWIGPYAFPLSSADDARTIAVNEPGYALLEVRTATDVRGVLVGPGGHVVELHSTAQDVDAVADISDRNIPVGSRTVGTERFGVAYGTTGVVRLEDLAAPGGGAAWGRYRDVVAVNRDGWVVGTFATPDAKRSWLLRPPGG